MNMRVAKEEIALLMPSSLSSYTNEPHVGETATRGGLISKLASAVHFLLDLPRRHAVVAELAALSDRELADIGLARSDLARVFDASFASRQNRRLGGAAIG